MFNVGNCKNVLGNSCLKCNVWRFLLVIRATVLQDMVILNLLVLITYWLVKNNIHKKCVTFVVFIYLYFQKHTIYR